MRFTGLWGVLPRSPFDLDDTLAITVRCGGTEQEALVLCRIITRRCSRKTCRFTADTAGVKRSQIYHDKVTSLAPSRAIEQAMRDAGLSAQEAAGANAAMMYFGQMAQPD